MFTTKVQDSAIDFMKAHPKATKAFCKAADLTTKGAFAGTVAVMGATAASADEPTTDVAGTVVDSLVSTCQSVVSSTYTKALPILAIIIGVNFGVRKVRGFIGA